ncbi:NAD(+)/NADH kinase [uncultured Megasphaera sp.]|uniref:NAD(+)/NADH kinase n=1 Tax=uncultured Megasphaera sp. TaxID=165188 RepID=UPI002658547F|nr:NAD(+)/NADH kinase [uncultured Megasphaera sp.]
MRIGIFPNLVKRECAAIVQQIIKICEDKGIAYYLPAYISESRQTTYQRIPPEHLRPRMTIYQSIDVALVLGGDGTILKMSKQFAEAGVPVCGVNLGSLGFLYEVETKMLSQRIQDILDGHYFIEDRMMLHSELCYDDGMIQTLPPALNDIVIGHGNVGKLIRVDMSINGHFIQQYPGDGIIVATATGSTGYTFSSGGPIVSPNVPCIMVTPICPHLLLKVPLVLSDADEISFTSANSRNSVRVSVDGVMDQEILRTMTLHVRKSEHVLKLIRFNQNYFYSNVFKKMMGNES